MTTKKTPDQVGGRDARRSERGRFARLLADGYVVEVETPTVKREPTTKVDPRPATRTT
jgi:hypothetical protein